MFKNPCAHRKIFFAIPIALIIVSILSMALRGFNLGIDFSGGSTLEIEHMPAGYTYSGEMEKDIEGIIASVNGESSSQIQSLGEDGMFIRISNLNDEQLDAVCDGIVNYFNGVEAVEDATEAATGEEVVFEETATEVATEAVIEVTTETATEASTEAVAAPVETETAAVEEATEVEAFNIGSINIEKVEATTSSDLIANTVKAVVIAIVLMLIYIGFRFDFKSGVSAVMALTHDVILMFGFYSLFQFEMNTSFVAAVLTIIGYSINATIIVFDRIRENNRVMRQFDVNARADKAIVSSYTRTIFSSLTTLFTIGALYVLGVSSIQEFALPIIVGIVCGAYSSLFVAPNFWALWKNTEEK